jgi:hypothetical protein
MAGLRDLLASIPLLKPMVDAVDPEDVTPDASTASANKTLITPAQVRFAKQNGVPEGLMGDTAFVHGYRANPQNKFGAKDRMETLPTEFHAPTMETYVRAAAAGTHFGVPKLTPEQFANMALHEGRDDFGTNYNAMDVTNKKQVEIYKNLVDNGHDDAAARFAAAIYGKTQTANRLKRPFLEVWNGAGPKARAYAKNSAVESYAATHPKNQEMLEFLTDHYNDQLEANTPNADPSKPAVDLVALRAKQQANQANQLDNLDQPAVDVMGNQVFKRGGLVDKPIKGNSKLI